MNKKIVLLFVMGFIFSLSVSAQFEIKGLVGLNFSNLSSNPDGAEVSGTAGYQFGAGVLIGNKFYVEPGIQFVRNSRDFTVSTGESIPDEEFKVDENLVKIPVYAGYHLLGAEDKPFALRVFAGPSVSILGSLKSDQDDTIDKDDLENARWALDAGLGLDVFFLFLEANYEWGISKYSTLENFDANPGAFMLNVGVHIDF